MPIPLQYEQMLFTCWVRILTTRLASDGVMLYEIYRIEQHLNQSGLKNCMPTYKIKAPHGGLIGLMNGESEVVRYDDDGPLAPNLPPLRELHEI